MPLARAMRRGRALKARFGVKGSHQAAGSFGTCGSLAGRRLAALDIGRVPVLEGGRAPLAAPGAGIKKTQPSALTGEGRRLGSRPTHASPAQLARPRDTYAQRS